MNSYVSEAFLCEISQIESASCIFVFSAHSSSPPLSSDGFSEAGASFAGSSVPPEDFFLDAEDAAKAARIELISASSSMEYVLAGAVCSAGFSVF
jgi:hypothetical protein